MKMTGSRALFIAVAAMLTVLLNACSLLTIRTPDKPLTAVEQRARMLSRDYAVHFAGRMVEAIDDAVPENAPSDVRSNALRLKIGIVTESGRAATGLSPTGDLLDIWAFAVQLQGYLTNGPGSVLLGSAQPPVQQEILQLAGEAEEISGKITGEDFTKYRTFISRYAFRHPLAGPDCARPSLLSTWVAEEGGDAPLRAEGTAAQAVADLSDRMRIYSEELPEVGLWHAELAMDRAGMDAENYRTVLRTLDARLARISALADTSPALVREAIADLRGSLTASSDRLDTAWMQMLRTLHTEREALAADIAAERGSLVEVADRERASLSEDAARIIDRAVDTSWVELRRLVREALLLLILLTALLLGLPFAAGYLVGRHRRTG